MARKKENSPRLLTEKDAKPIAGNAFGVAVVIDSTYSQRHRVVGRINGRDVCLHVDVDPAYGDRKMPRRVMVTLNEVID